MPEPAPEEIERAAQTLRRGGLVAFPTETVYGLAADAADPLAIRRLLAVKGRAPTQGLTIALPAGARLDDWATDIPREARRLTESFWPGPLTIVLRRRPEVPDLVTGGGDTVGLRVPAHPLAQQVLRRFGGGVVLPSANRHGGMSPTTAEAVRAELGEDVDVVLDGGPAALGIESTVVDCSRGQPRVLRLGALAVEEIERVAGPVRLAGEAERASLSRNRPGLRVEVLDSHHVGVRASELIVAGRRVGVLAMERPPGVPPEAVMLPHPASVEDYAHTLYERLREAERLALDVLLAVAPPPEGIGEAVADRLQRAAGG